MILDHINKTFKKLMVAVCLIFISINIFSIFATSGVPFNSNSISEEFDSIDTFNTHPVNRWDITQTDNAIITANNGELVINTTNRAVTNVINDYSFENHSEDYWSITGDCSFETTPFIGSYSCSLNDYTNAQIAQDLNCYIIATSCVLYAKASTTGQYLNVAVTYDDLTMTTLGSTLITTSFLAYTIQLQTKTLSDIKILYSGGTIGANIFVDNVFIYQETTNDCYYQIDRELQSVDQSLDIEYSVNKSTDFYYYPSDEYLNMYRYAGSAATVDSNDDTVTVSVTGSASGYLILLFDSSPYIYPSESITKVTFVAKSNKPVNVNIDRKDGSFLSYTTYTALTTSFKRYTITLDSDWNNYQAQKGYMITLYNTTSWAGTVVEFTDFNFLKEAVYDNTHNSISYLLLNSQNNHVVANFSQIYTTATECYFSLLLTDDEVIHAYYNSMSYTINDMTTIHLEIDFDCKRSLFEYTLYLNTSKTLTVEYSDFIISSRPYLFASDYLTLRLSDLLNSTQFFHQLIFVDFIETKFALRVWRQNKANSQSWDENKWNSIIASNITTEDSVEYQYTTDFFDVAVIESYIDHYGELGIFNDYMTTNISISNVDSCNGNIIPLFSVMHGYFYLDSGASTHHWLRVTLQDHIADEIIFTNTLMDCYDNSTLKTKFYTTNNRQTVHCDLLAFEMNKQSSSVTLVTNPSSEFIIKVKYTLNSVGSGVDSLMGVTDFSIVEKDIFADLGSFALGLVTPANLEIDLVGGFFSGVMNFLLPFILVISGLLSAIQSILDIIYNAFQVLFAQIIVELQNLYAQLSIISNLVELGFIAVTETLNSIVDVLNSILTVLGEIYDLLDEIGGIVGVISDTLDDILGFVEELLTAVANIITAIADIASMIVEAIIDNMDLLVVAFVNALIEAVNFLIELIMSVVDGLLDLLGIHDLLNTILEVIMTFADGLMSLFDSLLDTFALLISITDTIGIYAIPIIWFFVIVISVKEDIFLTIAEIIRTLSAKIFPNISILGFSLEIKLYMVMIPLTTVWLFWISTYV